jgi:hypothetical protein
MREIVFLKRNLEAREDKVSEVKDLIPSAAEFNIARLRI